MQDNKWYGVDTRKTLRANGIAQELRSDESLDGLVGRAFYDKILDVMAERSGSPPRTSRVGGTHPSSEGAGHNGKSYKDLPVEAKDACSRQAKKLVGSGRAYKDEASWQKAYAQIFFQGD